MARREKRRAERLKAGVAAGEEGRWPGCNGGVRSRDSRCHSEVESTMCINGLDAGVGRELSGW